MPSFILIHPTVWPQYTNVTDSHMTGQDRTMVRYHRANHFTNGHRKNAQKKRSSNKAVESVLRPGRESMVGKICEIGRS